MIGSIFRSANPVARPMARVVGRRPRPAPIRRYTIRNHVWRWTAACALAAAALLWFVDCQLAACRFDWSLLTGGIAGLRWNWLVMSLIPIFGTYYGRALRWAVFLKPIKPSPSIAGLTSATVMGFTAITLFGRPGELVRPYLIAKKEQVPVSSQFAAWLLERIFDLLMALLVFAFGLVRVRSSKLAASPELEWIIASGGRFAGIAGLAILGVIFGFRHLSGPLHGRIFAAFRFLPAHRFEKLRRVLSTFVDGIAAARSDGALILIFVYSAAEWLLIAAAYWSLAQSFPATSKFTIIDILIFQGFVSFGAAVQIPGIGGGMQVAAVLVLTEMFGMRLELATAFAFLLWFITFVAIVPVGLVLAFKEGLDWRGALAGARRTGGEVVP